MLGCMMPISSPMMKRMLGFCCSCAAAGRLAAVIAAIEASKPSHTYLTMLIFGFLLGYPSRAGSLYPETEIAGHDAEVIRLDVRGLRPRLPLMGEGKGAPSGTACASPRLRNADS